MRNLRKFMLLAVVATAAMALVPSGASAWTNPGNYTLTNTGGAANPLVSTVQSMGRPTISCNTLVFPTELGNGVFAAAPWSAEQDAGHVVATQGAVTRTTAACSTNLPSCTVVVATEGEWNLADANLANNNTIQIAGVHFTGAFAGVGCALAGETVEVFGNVEAAVSYPATGCAAGQERTRATFSNVDGLAVTGVTPVQAVGRGTPVRLNGFLETACLATALHPKMTAGV